MTPQRRWPVALTLLLVAVLAWELPGVSSAAYVASTRATATVGAASDWAPPTVSLDHPGPAVRGVVALSAVAWDDRSGVSGVVVEHRSAGAPGWTTVCALTTAPYTCSWDTRAVLDGPYDLRAKALDRAGYAALSEPLRTTVTNGLQVSLAHPGEVVRGAVALQADVVSAGSTTPTVRVEYSAAGEAAWRSICTGLVAPYSCAWNTRTLADEYYDLRAVAVVAGTTTSSQVVEDVQVDNQAPVATMLDPGSPLTGVRTFEVSASDSHSGLAQVEIQYAATGSPAFAPLCVLAAEASSCRVDTHALADGSYDFRAVGTDVAGNTTVSAPVTRRLVDNTLPSVSVENPGTHLSGAVVLRASAASTAVVANVTIQRATSGTSGWVDLCVTAVSPYTCTWDTRTVADGLHNLRAVMLDGAGRRVVSAVVAARRVDNSPLRGADVQSANGGTPGRLDAGDQVALRYTETVRWASLVNGWAGSPIPVTVRLRDGNLLGLGAKGDTLDVLYNGAVLSLGAVNLREDYVKHRKTSLWQATMSAETVTLDGTDVSAVTLHVGSLVSGGALRTVVNAGSMVWTPSPALTDLAGNRCAPMPVAESGAPDRDL